MKNIVRLKILTLFIFKKRKCYATFKIKLCWDKQTIYVKKRVISSDLSYSLKKLGLYTKKSIFFNFIGVFFFELFLKYCGDFIHGELLWWRDDIPEQYIWHITNVYIYVWRMSVIMEQQCLTGFVTRCF